MIVSKDLCRICGDGADEDEDDIADRSWVKCDKCGQWYHADCLGFFKVAQPSNFVFEIIW